MTFDKVKASTFNELQVEAGVLLSTFNPATPSIVDSNIIAATTGGISINCTSETSDWGEDIDNCPNNTKELIHVENFTCSISTTVLNVTEDVIKLALGAWTSATGGGIKPTNDLNNSHFRDLWWVGDRADGGMVAIHLLNALSTGGFQLQTSKNGKGTMAIELTGHVSISSPFDYPMEFFVTTGSSGTTGGTTGTT